MMNLLSQSRLFLLLLLSIPYWLWLYPSGHPPHLSAGSLWPVLYALTAGTAFTFAGWWLFEVEDDERADWFVRLAAGCFGGLLIVFVLQHAMSHPRLVARFFGEPAGWIMSLVGLGDSVKNWTILPLWASVVGYTLGVGLSEETAKAVTARVDPFETVRSRAALGFASGLGFGLGEALLYSYTQYAGHADWSLYAVRFVFCVGLHGCMSVVAVLSLPEDLHDWEDWLRAVPRLWPISLMHGAYDALLVRGHDVWAGLVAMVVILAVPAIIWWHEEQRGET